MKKQKLFLLSCCILLAGTQQVYAQQATKPNIVVILADDLGWADVGFNGAKDIQTPNIDKLAAGGVKVNTHYVMPLCTPSRAALMTGRYPMRYGLQTFVITPGQSYGLPTDEHTLAETLKSAGYKTFALGKWHLGHAKKKYWPQNRGFDYFYGATTGEINYFTKERGGVVDWQRNGETLDEKGYFTQLITGEAVKIIDQQKADQPFFIYMAHLAVHSPYQAPQKYLDQYAHIEDKYRRIYAAMAAAMDDSVGTVIDALDRNKLRDNTIVLFMSDNGGITAFDPTIALAKGKKPAPADNGIFRGSKSEVYEGGVRSATAINWPGHIKAGSETDEIVHMVDWLPTLAAIAGTKVSGDKALDGINVLPVIAQGAKSPHEDILINAEPKRGAVRQGKWKLVKFAALPSRVELYDLSVDPSEKNNIAEQQPKVTKELEQLLNEYAKQAKRSLFVKEYMPFVIEDASGPILQFDEDGGHADEKINLPIGSSDN